MTELLQSPLFITAWAAGIGVAMLAGPLGPFVVWRRMAYFGDAVAHSALLGIALSIALGVQSTFGIAASSLIVAFALTCLQRQQHFSGDTILGIAAHALLSAGIVLFAFIKSTRADLNGYLFGDILSVDRQDIIVIFSVVVLWLILIGRYWKRLVLMTIHAEMAHVEGIHINSMQLLLSCMLAVTIAVCVKIVGVLLITSLLILPAAAARSLARNPLQMTWIACIAGAIAVTIGLGTSFSWDLPTGPAIVLAEVALFFTALAARRSV